MDGDGELRLTIMATLAQEESRKTSERVRAGQKSVEIMAFYMGTVIFLDMTVLVIHMSSTKNRPKLSA